MGSPKTSAEKSTERGGPVLGFPRRGGEGSVQSYHWGTYGDSYEASLRGMVPFLGLQGCFFHQGLSTVNSTPGKTSASEIRPTKGGTCMTVPGW